MYKMYDSLRWDQTCHTCVCNYWMNCLERVSNYMFRIKSARIC